MLRVLFWIILAILIYESIIYYSDFYEEYKQVSIETAELNKSIEDNFDQKRHDEWCAEEMKGVRDVNNYRCWPGYEDIGL